MSDDAICEKRQRVCDLGFLRQGYRKPDGTIGWRCPGEPTKSYVRKGGKLEETVGRKCVCNGLLSSIGMGQRRHGEPEQPLVTSGNDVTGITKFLQSPEVTSYTAANVVTRLLSGIQAGHAFEV